jgi:hypothetical protein
MRLRTAKPSTHLHLLITPTAHHYRRLASFTVPLASTGMLIFFFVLLRPTWPRPPSRVHAPPCSPQLASRVTTVCIESPGDQLVSCQEPLRIADNSSPTSHNHQRNSPPPLIITVSPVGRKALRQGRTASRLRGLTPGRHPGVSAAMSSTRPLWEEQSA